MPDLIAQGTRREDRWRRSLRPGTSIVIGRSSGRWSISWDHHISREHIKVRWEENVLLVETMPRSSNPVFFQGVAVKSFRVKLGEHFVIGQTTFTLTDESVSVAIHARIPVTEQTFSPEYLRHLRFEDPSDRLRIISKIPERIAEATDSSNLHEQTVRTIFEGVPTANAAAICRVALDDPTNIEFLFWDRPDAQSLNASRRLISAAVESGQSVVHTWEPEQNDTLGATSPLGSDSPFTETDSAAWAFCIPFTGVATSGLALYVSGTRNAQRPGEDRDVQEEMKFAEIVVTTVGSFYEVRDLQKRQSSLGQFFSAPVINALQEGNADETLAPKEVDVTVLFCDLRGFSLAAEQNANDLLGLLQRVSDALGVLTKRILREGGVIGDFHGDAAMGFWGWPLPQEDAAQRAARAALSIFDEFSNVAKRTDHSLSKFRIGVGIASGRVVAGKIGTIDQVKVTAFGPAVNLASRLENMTKQLNCSILIDDATAAQLRSSVGADLRLRRLAVIQPYGMEAAIDVHQLLPTEEIYPVLKDEHIQHYESALDAFVAGDWNTAWEELHMVPAADPSKDFLTTYIASRSRRVPEDWDGVIKLESK